MFRVALIQNQSEMAHYGYADARPLLTDLGYEPNLYTADNIDTLGASLARGRFDAAVFGSNALNDKTIRAETTSEAFQRTFREWLSKGRGCLSFHQLRLATMSESTLAFLPPPLNTIRALVRPPTEKSADGDLAFGSRARDALLLLYPNRIEPHVVQHNALQFRSLPGLYWHSWTDVNLADWEILLEDPTASDGPRPLLVSAREPTDYRVVVSALTLDWQKQRAFLQNILTYVVEGRHNTALLLDEYNRSTAFDYLVGTLESRHYPFKRYFLGQDLSALELHVRNKIHNVLVLGPHVAVDKLPGAVATTIKKQVASGYLRLVTVEGQDPEVQRFSVAGRERSALPLLQTAELHIQAELRTGYIDGSFWSTGETLQTLQWLSPQSIGTYKNFVTRVLELADEHDRDGSYDEVFGVTCAFLWMRGTFLVVNSKSAKATASWIRERINRYDTREQVLAYLTFAELGILTEAEHQALVSVLTELRPERLSEIDLVVYLRAALVSKHIAVIPALVSALKGKQVGGVWVDLATTATAVATLTDVLIALRSQSTTYGSLKPDIESMIFGGIIYIQEALDRSVTASDSSPGYPWDGKASTTVKCIQAWLKFEELIDLPVYELVEALARYDVQSSRLLSGRQALSVLEDLKQDNGKLREEISQLVAQSKKVERRARRAFASGLCALILGYLLVTTLSAIAISGAIPLIAVLKTAFVEGWAFHLTFVAAVAAYLAIPWRNFIGGKD